MRITNREWIKMVSEQSITNRVNIMLNGMYFDIPSTKIGRLATVIKAIVHRLYIWTKKLL